MRKAKATLTVSGAATGDMSASFNSDPFNVIRMGTATVQAVVSAASSLNGAIKLQASNDLGNNPTGALADITGVTNWTDIAGASGTVTANGANMLSVADIGFRWLRLVYTRTGGAGTLAMTVSAKGVR